MKSYVSAIKAVLKEDGVTINEDQFLLNSLTRACKLKNDTIRTRLPIQKGMLYLITKQTDMHFSEKGQMYLLKLFKALFATAYFGMFRVSELTTGLHPVKVSDVHIGSNKKKLLFILRSSKTHGRYSKPQKVKITSVKQHKNRPKLKKVCAYELLKEFIEVRPGYISKHEPFFVFRDRTPVTPENMRNTLRTIIKECGFEPCLFGTHSFRAGRCHDLAKLGLSLGLIQKLGRWSSKSVLTYL